MSIKLHNFPLSPNGRKVAALAIELGLDVETVVVDMGNQAHKEPAYLAKNPNGKVPMLEEDGWVLWESVAIMQYLADKRGSSLYPSEPRLRAEVNKWLVWDAAHLQCESAFPLYWERWYGPMLKAAPRPEVHAVADQNFRRFAAVVNGAVEGKTYLVGGSFTLADLTVMGTMMFRDAAKLDLSPYPHLAAYLRLHEQRESWKKTAPPAMA